MISRVYISHHRDDEPMALRLSRALERVGLESYVSLYSLSPAIALAERVSFGVRNSECLVALLTEKGTTSADVGQEIGLARGIDQLIIPLLEEGAAMPFLVEHLLPIVFTEDSFDDCVGLLIKTIRGLSRLEWLKVSCPKCGEEMTQYLTPQEEVDSVLQKGSNLETICSYCQNRIYLDPRTFAPQQK
ncbi:MAG: toll/interleukin-1 receptor domain-containing protein [Methanothrix sp.]|nr:MAG: toll/interleukin-1 receptor domain-containing protein [Methanothrix sp.]